MCTRKMGPCLGMQGELLRRSCFKAEGQAHAECMLPHGTCACCSHAYLMERPAAVISSFTYLRPNEAHVRCSQVAGRA